MIALSGSDQTGTVGQSLSNPFVVKAQGSDGSARSGVVVSFTVTAGGGVLTAARDTTDAGGLASTRLTLGTVVGPNAVQASASGANGSPVFLATARPDVPAVVAATSADHQSGFVGLPLGAAPTVSVKDQFGNAVPGAPVGWLVVSGGGAVTAPTTDTDSAGLTSASWTLGSTPGANSLDAMVTGLPPVVFNATGVSAGTGRIVFDWGGNTYAMNPDGSGAVQLTNTADVSRLAISVDGSKVALVRTLPNPPGWGVYTMKSDGTGMVRLSSPDTAGYFYETVAWSPDGSKIAYDEGRGVISDIYVMNADGTGVRRVTDSTGTVDEPSWSADGLKIAFHKLNQQCQDIDVINLDGTGLASLTHCDPTSNTDFFDPAWSPDGKKIAFVGPQRTEDSTSIFIMNPDGSGTIRVTTDPGVLDWSPSWSPDGSKIVFARTPYNNIGASQLYSINIDGTGLVRIFTGNPPGGGNPAWGP